MSDEQCAVVAQASQNVAFNVLLFVKMLSCLGGAAFLLRQWKVHGVRFLGHVNSQVLFHAYYATFFVLGVCIGTLYLIDFIRLRLTCALLDFRVVVLLRGLTISCNLSVHFILILLSLERLYSSLFPARFEKSSAQTLTTILAVAVVTCATSYVMWNLTDRYRLFYGHYILLASAKVPQNTQNYLEVNMALTISNGCSLVIFLLDIYLNFYRKRGNNLSLGATYQVHYLTIATGLAVNEMAENRRVIRFLVPIEIIDSLLTWLTAIAQLVYAKFVTDDTPVFRQLYLESTTCINFFPLILAIIIERKVGRRKRAVFPSERSIDHFENLQKFWN